MSRQDANRVPGRIPTTQAARRGVRWRGAAVLGLAVVAAPAVVHARPQAVGGETTLAAARPETRAALLALPIGLDNDRSPVESPKRRQDQAEVYIRRSYEAANAGRTAEARKLCEDALAIRLKLVEEFPAVAQYRSDLAQAHSRLAYVQRLGGEAAAALRSCQAAIDIFARLVEENPAATLYREQLAREHGYLSTLQRETGDTAAALRSYRADLDIYAKLVEQHPANGCFRFSLSLRHNQIGTLQRDTGDTAAAMLSFQAAVEISRKLLADVSVDRKVLGKLSTDAVYRIELATSLSNVGGLQRAGKDHAGALLSFREAFELFRKVAEERPNWRTRSWFAGSQYHLGLAQNDAGDDGAAIRSYQGAVKLYQGALEEASDSRELDKSLRTCLRSLSDLQKKAGDQVARFDSERAIVDLDLKRADSNPKVPQYQTFVGRRLYQLACQAWATSKMVAFGDTFGPPQDLAEADALKATALSFMRQAIDQGFFLDPANAGPLAEEARLFPELRPELDALIMDARFPADPFVPTPGP